MPIVGIWPDAILNFFKHLLRAKSHRLSLSPFPNHDDGREGPVLGPPPDRMCAILITAISAICIALPDAMLRALSMRMPFELPAPIFWDICSGHFYMRMTFRKFHFSQTMKIR
jgi:hypothetical protein